MIVIVADAASCILSSRSLLMGQSLLLPNTPKHVVFVTLTMLNAVVYILSVISPRIIFKVSLKVDERHHYGLLARYFYRL